MHTKSIVTAGVNASSATNVLILLHGRGATAEDILSLGDHLAVQDFALIAPQATNYTWYPYSFLAPPKENEPWLSSALQLVDGLVNELKVKGIRSEQIYFSGFSQGACLTLEYVTRNAKRFGGVAAFTGGLIGDKIYSENYKGDFNGTPVFIGTSDPDPHVPVTRVNATTALLRSMNAAVTEKVYKNMGHTITEDEIAIANKIVFQK
jgi:phospholipase/carboxylesterase